MIIESLRLFYHIPCFKCCVCGIQLGNGSAGADVRVRNHKLHCHNCYSNDEGEPQTWLDTLAWVMCLFVFTSYISLMSNHSRNLTASQAQHCCEGSEKNQQQTKMCEILASLHPLLHIQVCNPSLYYVSFKLSLFNLQGWNSAKYSISAQGDRWSVAVSGAKSLRHVTPTGHVTTHILYCYKSVVLSVI